MDTLTFLRNSLAQAGYKYNAEFYNDRIGLQTLQYWANYRLPFIGPNYLTVRIK